MLPTAFQGTLFCNQSETLAAWVRNAAKNLAFHIYKVKKVETSPVEHCVHPGRIDRCPSSDDQQVALQLSNKACSVASPLSRQQSPAGLPG
jgi:hypothetical protein